MYGNNFREFSADESGGRGMKPIQITGFRRFGRGPGLDCVVFGVVIISRLYKFTHSDQAQVILQPVAYPGIFFGGGSTNSVEDRGQRGRGSGGGSPLVRGSGGSCNLVQEISFHIGKIFLIFGTSDYL